LTSRNGPYGTRSFTGSTGTIHYPTNAEPPFAGVALCGGFLNSGPEMASWGPFYASWGIVTVITSTFPTDIPDVRAAFLLGSIEELKKLNTTSDSPLFGKMAGRYGTSGYSMGGGGTTIATTKMTDLKSSVGLAAWGPVGGGIKTPTLFLCGDADAVAACFGDDAAYQAMPADTPKMIVVISGATHFNWFGPTDAGRGTSGAMALAFQKVFLEGDERWRKVLLTKPSGGTVSATNIK
jgi:hypothetical protein